jgi:hypothetical protein
MDTGKLLMKSKSKLSGYVPSYYRTIVSSLTGIYILVRRIRQLAEKAGGSWDPLGEDCDFQVGTSMLLHTFYYILLTSSPSRMLAGDFFLFRFF